MTTTHLPPAAVAAPAEPLGGPAPAPSAIEALAPSLRALARRGETRRFKKGQHLIEEGAHGDTLFIILSGRVRVYGRGSRDDRELTYGVVGAGEYIGELILDGGPRSASAEAVEACECVIVTRHTLLGHIAEHPEFALELLTRVIRRARSATDAAKRMALSDVYERLVMLLDSLAVALPDGTRRVPERLTHREMANRLGCSREMVSRLMKDLEAGGLVRTGADGLPQLMRALPARW